MSLDVAHSLYRTQYHVVWITKYRRRLFKNPGLRSAMHRMLYETTKSMPGIEILELNIQEEHVHVMVVIPPSYSVADVVQRMKGESSHRMRKLVKWFRKIYGKRENMWSPGYFVSTVGIDEEVIRRYVRYQGDLDSGQMKFDL